MYQHDLTLHPAEALHAVRAQIKALKAQEAELRRYFIKTKGAALAGPFHHVVVRAQTRRVFCKDRLPDSVHSNPALYSIRPGPVVAVKPIKSAEPPRSLPAQPARQLGFSDPSGTSQSWFEGEDGDMELIKARP